jgi:succinylarginine dihydrolase
MNALEANFDGLVGPTHNYSGLSFGNVASTASAAQKSNPREAALQGLAKMKALADLGIPQGVLPPHERPHLPTLRKLGFAGRDADVLKRARDESPHLLAAACSASAMWAANAATVSPSADTSDGRVHFTPANLFSNLHRAIEAPVTARILKAVFPGRDHFTHHAPLTATPLLGDEGAANHTRLCSDYGAPGLELFVFGKGDPRRQEREPKKFPARQTRSACGAIVRLHGLAPERALVAQQNPDAIDAGVFHNDVIAVGNREVLLYHERAFADTAAVRAWAESQLDRPPVFVEVRDNDVSVADAVATYLFNSQLVCPPGGGMLLVCARECEENERVWATIEAIVADKTNPIRAARVFDLRQSMKNGGGPACLRLRVVLTEAERGAVNSRCWITPKRHGELTAWVEKHYRDELSFADLADPKLLDESRTALDRLTRILGLGSVYDFQR